MSPSFLSVCLSDCSLCCTRTCSCGLSPCSAVLWHFGCLSLSARSNHPYISGECGMRLQVKHVVEGALELWLSFPATFSPSGLSPSPRARQWGLMGNGA